MIKIILILMGLFFYSKIYALAPQFNNHLETEFNKSYLIYTGRFKKRISFEDENIVQLVERMESHAKESKVMFKAKNSELFKIYYEHVLVSLYSSIHFENEDIINDNLKYLKSLLPKVNWDNFKNLQWNQGDLELIFDYFIFVFYQLKGTIPDLDKEKLINYSRVLASIDVIRNKSNRDPNNINAKNDLSSLWTYINSINKNVRDKYKEKNKKPGMKIVARDIEIQPYDQFKAIVNKVYSFILIESAIKRGDKNINGAESKKTQINHERFNQELWYKNFYNIYHQKYLTIEDIFPECIYWQICIQKDVDEYIFDEICKKYKYLRNLSCVKDDSDFTPLVLGYFLLIDDSYITALQSEMEATVERKKIILKKYPFIKPHEATYLTLFWSDISDYKRLEEIFPQKKLIIESV